MVISLGLYLQILDGVHAGFRHIVLREHRGYFLCAVVAVVEEDHCVAFLDRAVDVGVDDRLDELVGDAGVVSVWNFSAGVCGILLLDSV